MKPMIVMSIRRRTLLLTRVLAMLTMSGFATASHAVDTSPSQLPPPPGQGWQMLGSAQAADIAAASTPSLAVGAATSATSSKPSAPALTPVASVQTSTAVAPVVLAGSPSAAPSASLAFTVTPQDVNLRNALDKWLQQQGWQLAWKIDDDLPLEFNATFTGDFDSILTQVMRATDHMRTPTRVCEHTNNVIRVVARAANCQE